MSGFCLDGGTVCDDNVPLWIVCFLAVNSEGADLSLAIPWLLVPKKKSGIDQYKKHCWAYKRIEHLKVQVDLFCQIIKEMKSLVFLFS